MRTSEDVYAEMQKRMGTEEGAAETKDQVDKPDETKDIETKDTTTEPAGGHTEKDGEPVKQDKKEQVKEPAAAPVDDSVVLDYLKGKGIEVSTLDDIKKNPFASTEVEAFNKFVEETGRDNLDDYLKVKKDLSTINETELARELYLQQNPGSTKEDFDVLYDLDLKPLDPENYTEEEVVKREREIRKRDALLKLEGNKAREYFRQLQEKINTPKPPEPDTVARDREIWAENIRKATEDFDLGVEGYKPDIDKQKLAERYSTIENVVNSFKDESGNFNYNEFLTALEFGRNRNNILEFISQKSATKATESIVKELERPSETGTKEAQGQMSDEMQANRQAAENYVKNLFNY